MKKILILATLSATSQIGHSAEGVGEIPKAEAIKYILSPETILTEQEQLDISGIIMKQQEVEAATMSYMYDDVEPVRQPIFFDSSPSSEPATILVTPSRPTTITFFKQGGEKLKVTKVQKQLVSTPGSQSRFDVTQITGMEHAYSFKTTVRRGTTTVDFFFDGIDYAIPIQLEAGKKYHSSAQAILIDSDPVFNKKSENSSNSSHSSSMSSDLGQDNSALTEGSLRQIMYLYANYQQKPPRKQYQEVEVTYFSETTFEQPKVTAILSTIEGSKMFLLYTNGILRSPSFLASEPSNKPNERIYVYAIPEEDVTNLISIAYGGGTHLISLTPKNSLGLDRSARSINQAGGY